MNDTDLIKALKNRDPIAFEKVYNSYWEILMFHATRMLDDEDNAFDVVQDVFCSLWEKSSSIDIKSNLGGYLYRMTRFRVLNRIRDGRTGNEFKQGFAHYLDSAQENILADIHAKDLNQILEEEVQKLPKKMRDIFLLSRMELKTYKEISNQLGIADTTVKKQINNALKVLKIRLIRFLVFFV